MGLPVSGFLSPVESMERLDEVEEAAGTETVEVDEADEICEASTQKFVHVQ